MRACRRRCVEGSNITNKTHSAIEKDGNGISMGRGIHAASQYSSWAYDACHWT